MDDSSEDSDNWSLNKTDGKKQRIQSLPDTSVVFIS
jgi:hypothetical protein